MKIRSEQLLTHLNQTLSSVYLITGDEELIKLESSDSIRQTARNHGYTEREVFVVNSKFNWDKVYAATQSMSLFSEKSLIELHLESTNLGKDGSQILADLCERPPEDKCFLIICEKLDAAKQKTKWVKAIEQHGIMVPIWPVQLSQMPQWIDARCKQYNIQIDQAGLRLMCDRVEGNLLAAKQEIEKCHLLYGEGTLNYERVREAVSDNSRYDIFQLVDVALQGEPERVIKILLQLRSEGLDPILVLWAVHRELQLLCALSFALFNKTSLEPIFQEFRVWDNRKGLLTRAIQRYSFNVWQQLLSQCHMIDESLKGARKLDKWQALAQLYLRIAGFRSSSQLTP